MRVHAFVGSFVYLWLALRCACPACSLRGCVCASFRHAPRCAPYRAALCILAMLSVLLLLSLLVMGHLDWGRALIMLACDAPCAVYWLCFSQTARVPRFAQTARKLTKHSLVFEGRRWEGGREVYNKEGAPSACCQDHAIASESPKTFGEQRSIRKVHSHAMG